MRAAAAQLSEAQARYTALQTEHSHASTAVQRRVDEAAVQVADATQQYEDLARQLAAEQAQRSALQVRCCGWVGGREGVWRTNDWRGRHLEGLLFSLPAQTLSLIFSDPSLLAPTLPRSGKPRRWRQRRAWSGLRPLPSSRS